MSARVASKHEYHVENATRNRYGCVFKENKQIITL